MKEPNLFDWLAHTPSFDGKTYDSVKDHKRLGKQFLAVFQFMQDGQWRTLQQIAQAIQAPEASVSARLRDFRKFKFGSHIVERERLSRGLHRYRLIRKPNETAQSLP